MPPGSGTFNSLFEYAIIPSKTEEFPETTQEVIIIKPLWAAKTPTLRGNLRTLSELDLPISDWKVSTRYGQRLNLECAVTGLMT